MNVNKEERIFFRVGEVLWDLFNVVGVNWDGTTWETENVFFACLAEAIIHTTNRQLVNRYFVHSQVNCQVVQSIFSFVSIALTTLSFSPENG